MPVRYLGPPAQGPSVDALPGPVPVTVGRLANLSERALSELTQHIAAQPVDSKRIVGSTGSGQHFSATSNVAVTASSEATSQVIIDMPGITAGGTLFFQFYIPTFSTSVTGKTVKFVLWNETSAASTGLVGEYILSNASFNLGPVFIQTNSLDTPTAAHYSLRAFLSTASGTVTFVAGAGGVATYAPIQAWVSSA